MVLDFVSKDLQGLHIYLIKVNLITPQLCFDVKKLQDEKCDFICGNILHFGLDKLSRRRPFGKKR